MHGGQQGFALRIGGVAGGTGTTTLTRIAYGALAVPVHDLGVYRGGAIEVLVTSNTAAAASRLGEALPFCPRPPVLIVMHTVPGGLRGAARVHLRGAAAHAHRVLEIFHVRHWPDLDRPPGRSLPKPVQAVIRALPGAVRQMYASPAPGSDHMPQQAPGHAAGPGSPWRRAHLHARPSPTWPHPSGG